MPLAKTSTSIRWVSVPPETTRKPSACIVSASTVALATICAAYCLKSGCSSLAKRNRLRRDDVHQRAALLSGKYRTCRWPRRTAAGERIRPAAWPAQRLVRRGGDDLCMRNRRRMSAASNQSSEVRHVNNQQRARLVRDLAHARQNRRCADKRCRRR